MSMRTRGVIMADMFRQWEQLFIDGFGRMQRKGILRVDADPQKLATALIAAVQGGYLLAQTSHDPMPMKVALDMALDYIRTFQVAPDSTVPKPRTRTSRSV